ncbi:hypothetical protein [Psychroflexus planctonicus]|uniref:Uncharacterized protein n=1 Tax=Psychroflexus planctonicus TaxID=1526575 RepID=A0ABQ1SKE1_9FLAO|nr:hypothetical protein [Psychroflexus planctonicus]GGE40446.1 hypothetical protein GCM10010832_20710 [Psychroflexus planctonicus]
MESVDLRNSVLEFIKTKADTKFLKLVEALATTYQENASINRESLDEYNVDINNAIQEIENGDFYTQEDAKKIANQW